MLVRLVLRRIRARGDLLVLVDSRDGSKELVGPLKRAGLDVQSTRLEFGDVAFVGRGIKGAPLDIGIEHKQVGELITSLRDYRFSDYQLPGMTQMFDRSWLLVQGMWRSDDQGRIVTYHGRYRGWQPLHGKMTAVEFEKHMLTLENASGVAVRFTNSQQDSIRFILSLYRWFTDKDLDAHTSHIGVHTPRTLVPLSDFRAAVYRFPGIGLKGSLAVEQHFQGCLQDAVNANVDEWAAITTIDKKGKARRLGTKIATDVVAFCRRRNDVRSLTRKLNKIVKP